MRLQRAYSAARDERESSPRPVFPAIFRRRGGLYAVAAHIRGAPYPSIAV